MKIGDLVCWYDDDRYIGVVMANPTTNVYDDTYADVRWIDFPHDEIQSSFDKTIHSHNSRYLRILAEKK
jgi:hypothetical protein